MTNDYFTPFTERVSFIKDICYWVAKYGISVVCREVALVQKGDRSEQINASLLEQHLYTTSLPDRDLLIRTSDQMRLSNFLW